ncbi:MAG: aminodeoxychorismate synthase component I [Alphaproteobacteria bacterium]|nr:MAG: aminodeoxychorismate synthase component I [Alphaproteobacteria bacterium]
MTGINGIDAPFVLLDDSRPAHAGGRSMLFHSPEDIIVARTLDEVPGALARIDAAVAAGLHVAGWVAYECAAAFEPRLLSHMQQFADEPLVWMLATRHRDILDAGAITDGDAEAGLTFGNSVETRETYLAALGRIHAYIQAGDVYQINHTFPLPCLLSGRTIDLYRQLRAAQPVPYGALIDTGETEVVSLSPELFVRRQGNRLMSRPMKGTAPRGRTTEEDAAIAAGLRADEKSRAENLMIVDLIRNDLSRVATPASVRVEGLFDVERYATLHQMTSTITARVDDGLSPSALLRALFPCGSVTGAPKVRAMQIIAEQEKAPRGVYCGAIGHFSPSADGPDWTLNVPIRTLVLDKAGMGRLSVGSGVVADSDAGGEYDECLLKARFARAKAPDFSLIESLCYRPGKGYDRLELHLARLADSAGYFGFAFDEAAVRTALLTFARRADPTAPMKTRLLLAASGAVEITGAPILLSHEADPVRVCLSATTVQSTDPMLFHKTTRRQLYDEGFARAQAAGFADLLYFNERGELTEGAISNVFLVKDTEWTTPALECGLLPGVFRAALMSERPVREHVITRDALLAADTVYIGNSVRGLRPVTLDLTEL